MTHGAGKNFEYLFDQEIKRRLGVSDDKKDVMSHARIIGLETYYKTVFFDRYPFALNFDCSVVPSAWRQNDALAMWR
jgi:asparagine synthase (glutamine-hydrolysing)